MNIIYDDSSIFFSVYRVGKKTIRVGEGCVFYWAGVGTEIMTSGPINDGAIQPIKMPVSKFEEYGNEYPGDSFGRNYIIPEQELTVTKSGYIYLNIVFNNEDVNWRLSFTNDVGDIIPDGDYDGYTANYDTGCYMEITASVSYPVLDNISYYFSEIYDQSKIPIARVECSTGPQPKIVALKQIFEGTLCLTRDTEIISNNPTAEL